MLASTSTAQVSDLVRALAVAWKNLTAYPPGHPALARSLEAAHQRFVDLRGAAGEVTLGIAADAVIFGQDRIESQHVQKFAQALYHRGVAVVRFAADTTAKDLDTFLRLLGSGAPGEQKTPLWDQLTGAGVTNINLQPVDYSAVQITDDIREQEKKKSESLWDEILEALISGRELTPEARELLTQQIRSVEELSSMLLRYMDDLARQARRDFDPNATFGVRSVAAPTTDTPEAAQARVAESIALHIGESTGTKRQLAVQQVVQLLQTLPDPLRASIIRSVLKVLASEESAGSLLRDFTADLRNDEILDALRYLSSSGQLSSHAMMLMQSLAALESHHAAPPPPPTLLTDLVNLFGDDDPDRFNPPDHRTLLENTAVEMPAPQRIVPASEKLGARVDTIATEAVDRDLAETLLSMVEQYSAGRDARPLLVRLEPLFVSLLAATLFDDALEMVERLKQIAATAQNNTVLSAAVKETLDQMASAETMSTLVDALVNAPAQKSAPIQRLTELLGSIATQNLLVALAAESNRSRRRRLFDFVASLGPRIVPEIQPFLSDERWYVVRNMVVLLRTVQDRTTLPQIRDLATHSELRVRLEAIKTLLAFDSKVSAALLENAINDPDPKMAEKAIALVGNYGIKEGVGPLVKVLSHTDFFGKKKAIRLRAIKALGELADPAALPQMAKFFSDSILPWPARDERRAAYQSLGSYPRDVRFPYVERGLKSNDPVVREICTKLHR